MNLGSIRRLSALPCLLAAIVIGRPARGAAQALTVVYTGKLLGYARVPDRQVREPATTGCPSPDTSAKVNGSDNVAGMLLEQLHPQKDHLLVAMGDNFSPELDSRRFSDRTLKELYTSDGKSWVENGPGLKPLKQTIDTGQTII